MIPFNSSFTSEPIIVYDLPEPAEKERERERERERDDATSYQ